MATQNQHHAAPWNLHIHGTVVSVTAQDVVPGKHGSTLLMKTFDNDPRWLHTARMLRAAPEMRALLVQALTGAADEAWLTKVRDLIEDTVDVDDGSPQ